MYTQGTITIRYWDMFKLEYSRTVEGMISEKGIAYHLAPDKVNLYTLTHIRSGLAILNMIDASKIEALATQIEELTDWLQETIDQSIYKQVVMLLHRVGKHYETCEHCKQEYERVYKNGVPSPTQVPHCMVCAFCERVEQTTQGMVKHGRKGTRFVYSCSVCELLDE